MIGQALDRWAERQAYDRGQLRLKGVPDHTLVAAVAELRFRWAELVVAMWQSGPWRRL